MMRPVLAVFVFALAAGGHAAPHGKPRHAAPLATVRIEIVSGSPQSAPAYAAPASKAYVTEFSQLLVARMAGVPPNVERHVRFSCVSKDCTFVPADQPDAGKNVNKSDDGSYGVALAGGVASLRVSIKAPAPAGTYTVRAEPVVRKGERAVPASFTLVSR